MTTIEYEGTLEDIINFNLYHMKTSPMLRRQTLLWRITAALLAYIICFVCASIAVIDLDHNAWVIGVVVALLLGVLIFMIYPQYHRYETKRRLLKLVAEGDSTSLLGERTIAILDDGLLTKTSASETKYYWHSIGHIATDEAYAFVYVSSYTAEIVPKRAFPSEQDFRAFLAELGRHVSQAKETP